MNLLLDTHTFLWFIAADKRLPAGWKEYIDDLANSVFLSVAAIWETVIKQQANKLQLPEPAATYLPVQRQRHSITSLPVDESTISVLASLPPLHRDPFDRIIIAQAQQFDLTVATVDDVVRSYPIKLLDRA